MSPLCCLLTQVMSACVAITTEQVEPVRHNVPEHQMCKKKKKKSIIFHWPCTDCNRDLRHAVHSRSLLQETGRGLNTSNLPKRLTSWDAWLFWNSFVSLRCSVTILNRQRLSEKLEMHELCPCSPEQGEAQTFRWLTEGTRASTAAYFFSFLSLWRASGRCSASTRTSTVMTWSSTAAWSSLRSTTAGATLGPTATSTAVVSDTWWGTRCSRWTWRTWRWRCVSRQEAAHQSKNAHQTAGDDSVLHTDA